MGKDLISILHSETNFSLALICLRVEALYYNKRWVIRFVWILFVLFYVLRWGLTISGAVALSRKSNPWYNGYILTHLPQVTSNTPLLSICVLQNRPAISSWGSSSGRSHSFLTLSWLFLRAVKRITMLFCWNSHSGLQWYVNIGQCSLSTRTESYSPIKLAKLYTLLRDGILWVCYTNAFVLLLIELHIGTLSLSYVISKVLL